jgi:hypothetical protein
VPITAKASSNQKKIRVGHDRFSPHEHASNGGVTPSRGRVLRRRGPPASPDRALGADAPRTACGISAFGNDPWARMRYWAASVGGSPRVAKIRQPR